ncbi:MAG: hypothetical protein U0Q11_22710 [Vicinamibacterales bacterium]
MPEPLTYIIDAQDRIISVNEQWDVFARENLAPHLTSGVVGQPIWAFISNANVRQLYRQLLAHVRSGETVRVPFRCDAPELQRHMELELRPEPDGGVSFRSHTISMTPQARAYPQPGDDPLLVCGWCARVNVEAEWLSTAQAIERLGLFHEPSSPHMTHGICSECRMNVFARLSD